jgi:hypothetical protein
MPRKMTKKELEAEAAFAEEMYRRRNEVNRLAVAVLSGKPVPVPIKLNADELRKAGRQARDKGLRVTAYLTALVQEALERVETNTHKPGRKAAVHRRSDAK